MRVTDAGFALWGERLRGVAERAGAGRALSLLEGGYDLERTAPSGVQLCELYAVVT